MSALLQVKQLNKHFGGLHVLKNFNMELHKGEIVGILGPNGAGKTTLFNLISGDLQIDSGEVLFDGLPIHDAPPFQRCRDGIGRSYQVPQPFGAMSVFENLVTAACFGAQVSEKAAWQIASEVLEQTGLQRFANQAAGGLTLLNRKRLELARALATRPRLLLLDEIAGGLTEHEAHELVEELKRIKQSGMTMIWIEHVVHALLSLADRLLVINFGKTLCEGVPEVVMQDAEVGRVYMGLEV